MTEKRLVGDSPQGRPRNAGWVQGRWEAGGGNVVSWCHVVHMATSGGFAAPQGQREH